MCLFFAIVLLFVSFAVLCSLTSTVAGIVVAFAVFIIQLVLVGAFVYFSFRNWKEKFQREKIKAFLCLLLAIILILPVGFFTRVDWYNFTVFNYAPDCVELSGTHWQSEDGTITFFSRPACNANGQKIVSPNGQMIVNGETIEIRFVFFESMAGLSRVDSNEFLADFVCSFKSKKRFVAEVREGSAYFNKGDKITFYRVDE